jgi:multiple sugar transport system permease protein
MRAGRAARLTVRYVLALAALVVFLFPLYWLLATALKTPDEILAYPPVWWPHSPQLAGFAGLIENGDARAVINSLIVSLVSTALAVVLGAAGAYATVRAGLGGRLFAGWAVAGRMVPPVMVALPFFLLLAGIGWVGSLALVILLLTAFNLPYVLWMMRGYLSEVPAALEETALVAGLNHEQVLRQVTWPLMRGGLFATTAFTFVLAWNELVFALMLTSDAAETLPARLARHGLQPEMWAENAALGVVGVLPILIAVALMHRRLARSLSLGFVKD